jgi:hypothetical protein
MNIIKTTVAAAVIGAGIAAGALAAATNANADPAADDAAFYYQLLHFGPIFKLRAQENFSLIRLEALQACERLPHAKM